MSDIRSEGLKFPFYFLSDNHLSSKKTPAQHARLQDMLTLLEKVRVSGGTLFILGDFFDFWFDKGSYVHPVLRPVIESLRSLIGSGIEIHYLGGNHDYWIEGYLTKELGIRFYPDGVHFSIEGKRIYCQHGDHIVYNHSRYLLIRRILRHPLAIGVLRLLPVSLIYKLGESVSHYNRNISDIPQVSDSLIGKMHAHLREKLDNGYDIAVSGHVHAPHIETKDGKTIAVLGDWIGYRTYGYMDEKGFRLIGVTKQ